MTRSNLISRSAFAIAIVATFSGRAALPISAPQLTAHRQESAVYVSFEMHAQDYDELDARLARNVASVSWIVELHLWSRLSFDRLLATAMVRAFARRAENGTFVVWRVVNGETVESDTRVNLDGARAWLTSFSDLRLFEAYQLAHDADHRLTIRATLDGGGRPAIVTSNLARVRLQRGL